MVCYGEYSEASRKLLRQSFSTIASDRNAVDPIRRRRNRVFRNYRWNKVSRFPHTADLPSTATKCSRTKVPHDRNASKPRLQNRMALRSLVVAETALPSQFPAANRI